MPSHSRAVELNMPEAVMLADLYGIAYDLEASQQYCEKVIELGDLEKRDYFVEEGLMIAAVVKYGRCFTEGIRLSLKRKDIEDLESDGAEAHEYYLALRHRFIAHPVNPFEEAYVTTTATEKDGELLPITSVNPGQNRVILSAESAPSLLQLVRRVRAIVEDRVAAEERRVLAFLDTLPLEQIHAAEVRRAMPFKAEDVHSRRTRGANAQKRVKP